MTMVYTVVPKSAAQHLHPGDRIVARRASSRTSPNSSDVRVVGTQDSDSDAGPPRRAPLNVGDEHPADAVLRSAEPRVHVQRFRGKTVVLAFVYTRCRDRACARWCPRTSLAAAQARGSAGPPGRDHARSRGSTRPTCWRTTPAVSTPTPTWTFGTGPQTVVNDFAARFGIAVFADPSAGLIHSERTAIIDRNGVDRGSARRRGVECG